MSEAGGCLTLSSLHPDWQSHSALLVSNHHPHASKLHMQTCLSYSACAEDVQSSTSPPVKIRVTGVPHMAMAQQQLCRGLGGADQVLDPLDKCHCSQPAACPVPLLLCRRLSGRSWWRRMG